MLDDDPVITPPNRGIRTASAKEQSFELTFLTSSAVDELEERLSNLVTTQIDGLLPLASVSRRRFAKSFSNALAACVLAPRWLTPIESACSTCCYDANGELRALRYFDIWGPNNSVVTDQLHVGKPFAATAVFDNGLADYVAYEYRQYIKGYICYKRKGYSNWQCIALHLKDGEILDPIKFHEDGIKDAAYGYRRGGGCSDRFGPDTYTRQNGWLYTAEDFPGMKDIYGTEYQIKLDFCLQIVQVKTGASSAPKMLSVSCYGELPQVHVGELPEQPPTVPPWLKKEDGRPSTVAVTTIKSFPSVQYEVRLILSNEQPTARLYICFIKPNNAPPIKSFSFEVRYLRGSPLSIMHQVEGEDLPEARSGGTTAQALVEISTSELERLATVTVLLGADFVSFSAQELQLT